MKRNIGLFLFNIILIISMLGLPGQGSASRVQAGTEALAGTALSFTGSGTTKQHVTFGDTSMVRGTLTGTPTWNLSANSKLGASSLTFNGTSQYVTFGAAPELGATNFTLEAWIYWGGGGGTGTTGAGGLTAAIPIVTKGRDQADGSNVDANYYLGIQGGKLAADFEDMATGSNHPIIGGTTITTNTWHHAAVTYDSVSAVWTLYLDGVADGTLDLGSDVLPRYDSIQYAAIGSSQNSTGGASGFFQGRIDEVRIWNITRTQTEIQNSMNSEILTPTAGLLGRWGLNDGSGTTASNLNRLGLTSFTLEAWVKRAAGGVTMTTGGLGFDGAGGRPNGAYPILAKGMGEGETPANINTNWFLGITVDGFVGADFEDTAGGVNHPAWGTRSIPLNEWHHIVATYTGSCWLLYVDGTLDPLNALVAGCPGATPESTSYQRAGLSAGINSTGGLGTGFFSGVIDEARVWNRALGAGEILANQYLELTSGTGLVARWGLNEGSGTSTASSVGTFTGTLTNGPTWVNGFPDNILPAAPTGLTATGVVGAVNLSWTAPADSDIAGYNVYRGTTTGVYDPTPINGGSLVPGVSYPDTSGIAGTPYFYVVKTVDTSGNPSPASLEATGTPLADTPPNAPSGLTATPTSAMLVTLNWTDNSNNETGFEIHRSTTGIGGAYTLLTTTAADAITYPNSGLIPVTEYCYKLRAVNGTGLSAFTSPSCATTLAEPSSALQFNGSTQYVAFGTAPGLGVQTFTLECWFNWTGAGTTANTGSGGVTAIPLITKGLHQSDGSNVDANFFLGITTTGKVAADFEEYGGGQNYPVTGNTTVTTGSWHHLAVTYDGQTWKIYLDGILDTSLTLPAPHIPRYDSIQKAGLGAAMDSASTVEGRFAGVIDEARIWNIARTQSEIRSTINSEITSGSGLVARWGMYEGTGTTIDSSVGTFPGTLSINTMWTTSGAPFDIVLDTTSPAAPTGLSATPGNTTVALSWTANGEGDLGGYNIYRSTSPGVPLTGPINGSTLVSKTATTYNDTGRINGQIYYYVITAVDTSANQSGASNEVNATPFIDTTPPAAPTLLTAVGANAMITLDWSDNSDPDLAGYNVYRATSSGGVFTKVNVSLIVPSMYIDTGLINGTEYYYVVRAVDTSANESTDSNEASAIPTIDLGSALQFDGTDDYVTFGPTPALGSQNFTVEIWFKRTAAGTSISTGTNGVTLVPLITKGAPQAEGSSVDENYILGIRASDNVLAGDFEIYEACNSRPAGDNNPIVGVTPIVNDTWYHAAFTYDGAALKLYLNGRLESTLTSTCIPRYDNTQPAALGTTITTAPLAQGFFAGILDEARIWNVARTQSQILSTINQQITSGTGLLARWGLNEGTGTTIASSVGSFPGTLTNGPTWVPGAPFNLNISPNMPTLVSPADGSTGISMPPNLTVHVTDALVSPLTVSFYGRLKNGSAGADFTLIAIPDPQYYAASYPSIYNAQMTWVVANKTSSNIPYVMSMGDNVDDISNSTQWTRATTAWDILTTGSVPYGLELGNHDGAPSSTANFNTNFGTRIAGQSTYAGRYGTSDYDNTYATFSASGMDFIVLYIEYDTSMTSTSNPVLVWANGILAANPTKRAIVVTHDLLDNSSNFTPQGNAIYEALKGNANLFLMLSGHLDGSRQKTSIYNGHTVYSLRSDYQFVDSQQSGYLRIMRFSPVADQIYITTYSPNQSKYLTDTTNQFNLSYAMDGSAAFTFIGSTTVPSGSDATVSWPGLAGNTAYEWYAVADNGGASTSSPTWSFTTASLGNNPPVITEGTSASVTMSEDGSPIPFALTLHATDPDVSDTLTWSISTPASNGTATASGTGTSKAIGYTPTANYNGSDSFVVQVSDGNGGTDTITVNVTITAVNDAPVITESDPANVSMSEDGSPTPFALTLHATDVDGDTLTWSISTPALHGTATASGTGTSKDISYTPNSHYTGVDSFVVQVSDGNGGTDTITVNVTISAVIPPSFTIFLPLVLR